MVLDDNLNMPCMDSFGDSCSCTGEPFKSRCDELARMLCFLLGELKFDNLIDVYIDDAISEWWDLHCEADTKRVSGVINEMYSDKPSLKPAEVSRELINEAFKVHSVSRYHIDWFLELADKIKKEIKVREDAISKEKEIKKKALSRLTLKEKKLLGL